MRVLLMLIGCLLGGALFWLPSIVVHRAAGLSFGSTTVLISTIGCVVVGIIVVGGLRHLPVSRIARMAGLLVFLAAVWGIGPWAILAGYPGRLSEVGLHSHFTRNSIDLPTSTMIASTYDGTLGALLIVTALVLLAAFVDGATAAWKGLTRAWSRP